MTNNQPTYLTSDVLSYLPVIVKATEDFDWEHDGDISLTTTSLVPAHEGLSDVMMGVSPSPQEKGFLTNLIKAGILERCYTHMGSMNGPDKELDAVRLTSAGFDLAVKVCPEFQFFAEGKENYPA